MTLIAYSPLAQGLLAGKYRKRRPRSLMRRFFSYLKYWRSGISDILRVLEEICAERGVNIPQVALSWVIRHENVIAIPGAKKKEHVVQNAKASDLVLSEEELSRIMLSR